MGALKRRKLDVLWAVIAALAIGFITAIAAVAGDTERIATYWTLAEIDENGGAQLTEVIDYDYGVEQRHGIFRDVPGLDGNDSIVVDSPTAPDEFTVSPGFETQIRIGDPTRTVSGRHRYTIGYPLDSLRDGDRISWNAVGTGWQVPISHAVIHLMTPFDLTDLSCDRGSSGANGGCTIVEDRPGRFRVDATQLGSHEGITVSGTIGDRLREPVPPPEIPTGPADDPGSGVIRAALVAAAASLVGGFAIAPFIRRRGRELVYEGGAADAAFGDDKLGVREADYEELHEMATIEFAPPKDLSATLGGVVYTESVRPHHKVAWMVEAAIRDEVELTETEDRKPKMTLHRGGAEPNVEVAQILDKMFGGRDEVELGKYDKTFTKGWQKLESRLEDWRETSDLWDEAGERRRKRAIGFGVLASIIGAGLAALGGVLSNRWNEAWLPLVILGAFLAGGGVATLVRSWELAVRSPRGSALWIQIESFRRFIHDSEAYHAQQAAERGYLREYTAWAVALDELDHWNKAVDEAAKTMDVAPYRSDFAFAAAAPHFASATRAAGTKPSSSGGGGGGGVGGGGGGGGGGSW